MGAAWAVGLFWEPGTAATIALSVGAFVVLGALAGRVLDDAADSRGVRSRTRLLLVIEAVLLALFVAVSAFLVVRDAVQDDATVPGTPAQVTNVVDGDTIDVRIDGREYRVRYIGVDTPETVHPTRGVEPYGLEASRRNRELVEGRTVYLEKDVSESDRFDRLLRYVWLEDGRMVNAVLVAEGYAHVATFPPDVRHAEEFLELERAARAEGRGLWAD